MLANLISNAHKYSPTDQAVRVRVWRDNGWAMAAVADRGRGIPREELDRVFEKFHRPEPAEDADPAGRDHPDDGLPAGARARRAADPLCRSS